MLCNSYLFASGQSWWPPSSPNLGTWAVRRWLNDVERPPSRYIPMRSDGRWRIPVNIWSVSWVGHHPMLLHEMVHLVVDMSTSCGTPWSLETWHWMDNIGCRSLLIDLIGCLVFFFLSLHPSWPHFFQVDRNHIPVGALMCQHRDVGMAWHGLTQGLTWLEPRTQGTQRWWRWGWARPCQADQNRGLRCRWCGEAFAPHGNFIQKVCYGNWQYLVNIMLHHVTSCLYSEFSVQDGSGDHYLRSPGACGWKQIQIQICKDPPATESAEAPEDVVANLSNAAGYPSRSSTSHDTTFHIMQCIHIYQFVYNDLYLHSAEICRILVDVWYVFFSDYRVLGCPKRKFPHHPAGWNPRAGRLTIFTHRWSDPSVGLAGLTCLSWKKWAAWHESQGMLMTWWHMMTPQFSTDSGDFWSRCLDSNPIHLSRWCFRFGLLQVAQSGGDCVAGCERRPARKRGYQTSPHLSFWWGWELGVVMSNTTR